MITIHFRHAFTVIACFLLSIAAWSQALAAQSTLHTQLAPGLHTDLSIITGDGQVRRFDVFIPKEVSSEKAAGALVFDLHGFASTATQQRAISGMLRTASINGFVVIWPQGLGNSWNSPTYGPLEYINFAQNNQIDDVHFILSLIDWAEYNLDIAHARIFATGVSNGGGMVHRLALQAPGVFAAIAPVSYPLTERELWASGIPSVGTPILRIHGKKDIFVMYPCSLISDLGCIEEGFANWAHINQCNENSTITQNLGLAPFKPFSRKVTYSGCANHVETTLMVLEGGHLPYINKNHVNVSDSIWSFFSRYAH